MIWYHYTLWERLVPPQGRGKERRSYPAQHQQNYAPSARGKPYGDRWATPVHCASNGRSAAGCKTQRGRETVTDCVLNSPEVRRTSSWHVLGGTEDYEPPEKSGRKREEATTLTGTVN